MRSSIIFIGVILFMDACKSKPGSASTEESKIIVPGEAASVKTVEQLVNNKDYVMFKAGLYDPVSADTVHPYEWIEEGRDLSEFRKMFLEKEMTLEFVFHDDSTGVIYYDKQPGADSNGSPRNTRIATNMTWRADDRSLPGELPGIKLRITTEQRNSLDGVMEKLVSSYYVIGADEIGIMLETPRSYLNKKVVVIMKEKK